MRIRIVGVGFPLILLCLSLCYWSIPFTQSKSSENSFIEYPRQELGRILSENDTVLVGKVIKNTHARVAEIYDHSFAYTAFRATIDVLMVVKGKAGLTEVSFDYVVATKGATKSVPLSIGQTILYTPSNIIKNTDNRPVWFEPYILLVSDGRNVLNLWYENIDLEVGAKVLRFLGYEVFDKQTAMRVFEEFYLDTVSEDIDVVLSTRYDRWIIQGKCRRLFGLGCKQRDFCYAVSSVDGRPFRCKRYVKDISRILF